MRLFIAEKPSLAVAILEGLGGDAKRDKRNGYYQHGNDVITYCFGHLLRLKSAKDIDPEKYKFWDLKNLPMKSIYPPQYAPIADSEKQLNIVLELINKSDELVNAGDTDAAGCEIINEVIRYSGYYDREESRKKKVKRVLITDLNIEPVKKALNNLKDNEDFNDLSDSELARAIADLAFGYNMTELYTLSCRKSGYIGDVRVGRVITNILGLVNQRTLLNQNHVKNYFYDISGIGVFDNNEFDTKFIPDKDLYELNEKNNLISEEAANEIKISNEGKSFIVESVKTKEELKHSPNAFSLSSLQILAAKKWGYSSKIVLGAMQQLYLKKYISYPRTDSTLLTDSIYLTASEIVNNIKNTAPEFFDLCDGVDLNLKHKTFSGDDKSSHHAIAPTLVKADIDTLDEIEKNLYKEILNNFINLFKPPSKREKTKIILKNDEFKFSSTQTILTFSGWEDKPEPTKDLEQADISLLKEGDEVKVSNIKIAKKETTPPKYFVESSLLTTMTRAAKFIKDPELRKILEARDADNKNESGSIGTEATRAELIEKCKNNKDLFSLEKEKGYKELVWKTTKQGQELAKMLPDEITMPDISALWEEKLAQIRAGTLTVEQFIEYIDKGIAERVNHVKEHGVKITRNTHACPKCDMGLIRFRSPKTKKFSWRCDGYPECTEIFSDLGGKPQLDKTNKKKAIISEHKCTVCNSGLIKKRAKGKSFWGCSGYPDCNKTYPDIGNKPKYK